LFDLLKVQRCALVELAVVWVSWIYRGAVQKKTENMATVELMATDWRDRLWRCIAARSLYLIGRYPQLRSSRLRKRQLGLESMRCCRRMGLSGFSRHGAAVKTQGISAGLS
jgi:hypothetical protein